MAWQTACHNVPERLPWCRMVPEKSSNGFLSSLGFTESAVEGWLNRKALEAASLYYEPNELPLLHPASIGLLTIRVEFGIVNGAGNYFFSFDESFLPG